MTFIDNWKQIDTDLREEAANREKVREEQKQKELAEFIDPVVPRVKNHMSPNGQTRWVGVHDPRNRDVPEMIMTVQFQYLLGRDHMTIIELIAKAGTDDEVLGVSSDEVKLAAIADQPNKRSVEVYNSNGIKHLDPLDDSDNDYLHLADVVREALDRLDDMAASQPKTESESTTS